MVFQSRICLDIFPIERWKQHFYEQQKRYYLYRMTTTSSRRHFNIALEGIKLQIELNIRAMVSTKSGQFLCFSDDMIIITRPFGAVQCTPARNANQR